MWPASGQYRSLEIKLKFSILDDQGNPEGFEYPNLFFVEDLAVGKRLTIGAKNKQINLIDRLANGWGSDQFYILYILLISHGGREPGRYQSPIIESFKDLRLFLYTFQEFFEGDGRHHIWVSSSKDDTLVYDQHDVIFAYGDIPEYVEALINDGFTEKEFRFPAPHAHSYPAENVKYEDELFAYWEWKKYPLQEGDEY